MGGESAPEVGDAPRCGEAAGVDPRRVWCRADEARVRPAGGQLHGRVLAGRHDAQFARALQLEFEFERIRVGSIGSHAWRWCLNPRLKNADPRRPRHESLWLAVPAHIDRARDAPGIGDAETDGCLVPEDCRRRWPDVGHRWLRELATDLQLRCIDHNREERAFAFGWIDGAVDLESLRQEVIGAHRVLLATGGVDPRVPIGHRQHRTADGLRSAPAFTDFRGDLIAPCRPFVHHAAHHRQRHVQRHQNDSHDQQPKHR